MNSRRPLRPSSSGTPAGAHSMRLMIAAPEALFNSQFAEKCHCMAYQMNFHHVPPPHSAIHRPGQRTLKHQAPALNFKVEKSAPCE